MKTKEELNALRTEIEALNKKLTELTEEELAQVSGGGESAHPAQDDTLYIDQELNAGVRVVTTPSAESPNPSDLLGNRANLLPGSNICGKNIDIRAKGIGY